MDAKCSNSSLPADVKNDARIRLGKEQAPFNNRVFFGWNRQATERLLRTIASLNRSIDMDLLSEDAGATSTSRTRPCPTATLRSEMLFDGWGRDAARRLTLQLRMTKAIADVAAGKC